MSGQRACHPVHSIAFFDLWIFWLSSIHRFGMINNVCRQCIEHFYLAVMDPGSRTLALKAILSNFSVGVLTDAKHFIITSGTYEKEAIIFVIVGLTDKNYIIYKTVSSQNKEN